MAANIITAAIPLWTHLRMGICESSAASPNNGSEAPIMTEKMPLVARMTLPKTGFISANPARSATCEPIQSNE